MFEISTLRFDEFEQGVVPVVVDDGFFRRRRLLCGGLLEVAIGDEQLFVVNERLVLRFEHAVGSGRGGQGRKAQVGVGDPRGRCGRRDRGGETRLCGALVLVKSVDGQVGCGCRSGRSRAGLGKRVRASWNIAVRGGNRGGPDNFGRIPRGRRRRRRRRRRMKSTKLGDQWERDGQGGKDGRRRRGTSESRRENRRKRRCRDRGKER